MVWTIINSIATAVSMVAFILTAVFIRRQLQAIEKDRYLHVTNELFSVWQSRDFMQDQFWLIHTMTESTWEDFVRKHRGDIGEVAFHRVGSFYDRVGTLVRLGLVSDVEILSTVGAHAIAVWQKISPLVREARKIESSRLFDDFERLLPKCHECYVPDLGNTGEVRPFELIQPRDVEQSVAKSFVRVTTAELANRLRVGEPIALLDVRLPKQKESGPASIPGSIEVPLDDLPSRFAELPKDMTIVTYCACPNEESSGKAAQFLTRRGYRSEALIGGIAAWTRDQFTVETQPLETAVT